MKRIVFLVDMDAFFISCEALRNSEILNRIAGIYILLAHEEYLRL